MRGALLCSALSAGAIAHAESLGPNERVVVGRVIERIEASERATGREELSLVPSQASRPRETIEQIADRLSWRWAPVYVQHVAGNDRGADRPTRVDFDGNWDATDNWRNQGKRRAALPPAAYGAAILTRTRAYLTYTLFYPRDWWRVCVSLVCHDNDLETVQLVVERDASDGKLVGIRTKAHHSMTDTKASDVAMSADGRPMLTVEARGHGISVCKKDDPRCEARDGRIVYAPGKTASEPPAKATGQTVSYELLSMRDTLWARRATSNGKLWTDGETGPLYYHGSAQGRLGNVMGAAMATSKYDGGVRPPWALKGASGKRGDWFLDPAPGEKYEYNPYLDDLAAECRGDKCKPAPPERSKYAYYAKLSAPYVVLVLGAAVLTGGLVRSRGALLRF